MRFKTHKITLPVMIKNGLGEKYDVEKMKDNSESDEDRGVETDYSAEEAEQIGAFVEDALSFKDARESIEDFESNDQRRLCYPVQTPRTLLSRAKSHNLD